MALQFYSVLSFSPTFFTHVRAPHTHTGLSCGQTVWVCCKVHRLQQCCAKRLCAASIFERL